MIMSNVQININEHADGVTCQGCTFMEEHKKRMERRVKDQNCDRFYCIYPTDHGGVYGKHRSGEIQVKLVLDDTEPGRSAIFDQEVAEISDFLYNLFNIV